MSGRLTRIKNGSVTTPEGFAASGMHAGIKANARKFDCSLIVSKTPAVSASMYTINQAKAWPVLYDEQVAAQKTHRAILANSGNANCFNGLGGKKTVAASLDLLSRALKVKKQEIFLSSTGIIGKPFPIEKLKAAIPQLVANLSKSGGHEAAWGILTTDTCPKEIAVRFRAGGKSVTLAGMAKGAGMAYPHMRLSGKRHATMLCYLTTDAVITKPLLREALEQAVNRTFNCMAVDNDMSTNDTVIILANGRACNRAILRRGKDFATFQAALAHVCLYLARELVKDGEGVRHVCEVRVRGARNPSEADRAGRTIITSMLVKTMLAGEDPNWGRVIGCIGASQAAFSKSLDISFDGVFMLKNGEPRESNRARLRNVLRKKEFVLEIDLKKGKSEASFLMTDLTKFYVWINSAYSS